MKNKKKAFVTGGSRGIGRGVVSILSEAGYDVSFTYNSQKQEAQALQAKVKGDGNASYIYQASMENEQVPEEVTKRAIADMGGIDLLVCNAGLTKHNDLLTLKQDLVDFVYALNYRSYLMCAGVAARDMVARKEEGNIIFIASTRGLRAYPEDAIYGGLKAALIRSAESMALDMAQYGIRVNCVAPGATMIRGDFSKEELSEGAFAKRIPLGRKGSPREVGNLVKYLASKEASYITGTTIKIDGGLILPGMPEE
ncbi:SDR family oxidoreductase [Lachnospiraceae bacterium OttesenSCG-928-D06]|nr:SDR family oxidoreductase [Lachnospiraceae bacterium OttesenSCG-928-D06]